MSSSEEEKSSDNKLLMTTITDGNASNSQCNTPAKRDFASMEKERINTFTSRESLKATLSDSDPVTGALMSDATMLPCGHSFGAGGSKEVKRMKTCFTCSQTTSEGSEKPNPRSAGLELVLREDKEEKSSPMDRHKLVMNTSSDGNVSYSVPHDLQMLIAQELPVKSLLRFLSVSKLWEWTFRSQDFINSYLSKSLARSPERQGLLFTFVCGDKCFVFSLPRLENANEVSSSSIASYNLTSPSRVPIVPSVHGLICYGPASRLVLYNPCTRESVSLPMINLEMRRRIDHYVGYDPVDSVYKVLCVMHVMADEHDLGMVRVLTLGKEHEHLWRMVENVPHHSPTSHEMCIDGVLYYGAFTDEDLTQPSIMRFDVRSEVFELIIGPENAGVEFLTSYSKLTSYQGKLAVIFMEDEAVVFWVLEDDGWLKKSFDLPSLFGFTTDLHLQLFSGTNVGEIILAPVFPHASTFRVVYYDPKKDNFKKIEIEGITANNVPDEVADWWYCRTISVFPYQIENLLFLKAKLD